FHKFQFVYCNIKVGRRNSFSTAWHGALNDARGLYPQALRFPGVVLPSLSCICRRAPQQARDAPRNILYHVLPDSRMRCFVPGTYLVLTFLLTRISRSPLYPRVSSKLPPLLKCLR
ncbi:unnamed protein product, partial [Ectocarpus sp. 6 AP-2014]